jgi:hypothetical protein
LAQWWTSYGEPIHYSNLGDEEEDIGHRKGFSLNQNQANEV